MAPRLLEKYKNEVVSQLVEKFGYKNINEVPKLEKITLNVGLGKAKDNPKMLDAIVKELALISGQAPVVTHARKSIANFKLREGMKIGAKVTLRGDKMYYFLDKFVNISLPRVRDFRGVSDRSFDGRGNYATGVREQLIFPEIIYDEVEERYTVWTSLLLQRLRQTRKQKNYWVFSVCRSENKEDFNGKEIKDSKSKENS